ncbi:hypothetical protein PR048_017992 [Dryococelus australis]|uniref:Uncharacterized protein n=1 Tax=Dryococelus australis TaxID=614101 RepID=A0ABQ9HB73_9NEOP|nr:hypothetical protein PR048_017992 [Dryococelus australis]
MFVPSPSKCAVFIFELHGLADDRSCLHLFVLRGFSMLDAFSRHMSTTQELEFSINPPTCQSSYAVGSPSYDTMISLVVQQGLVVRPLTFYLGKPGSIPCGIAPGFSNVRIVPDDAASRRVFSEISRFPCAFIPALLSTRLTSPSSSLKTSLLRGIICTETINVIFNVSTGIKFLIKRPGILWYEPGLCGEWPPDARCIGHATQDGGLFVSSLSQAVAGMEPAVWHKKRTISPRVMNNSVVRLSSQTSLHETHPAAVHEMSAADYVVRSSILKPPVCSWRQSVCDFLQEFPVGIAYAPGTVSLQPKFCARFSQRRRYIHWDSQGFRKVRYVMSCGTIALHGTIQHDIDALHLIEYEGAGETGYPRENPPTASSGTIPTCENRVTRLGIEPG